MNMDNDIKIVELKKNDVYPSSLASKYLTFGYYDLSINREPNCWKVGLILRSFEKALDKNYKGKLFEDHVEEPRLLAAEQSSTQVGWIELGYEKWNNRMRVWEFLVQEGFRRRRIGTLLMNRAVKIAEERGARMLVLETQTCDVPAINFYLKFGFELIGFDAAAYSNEDVEKKEVRLELGLRLGERALC
jgi:ribosomal protein S18 acetylase RimI-like enzyme